MGTYIVVGGSRGIGAGIAQGLLAQGHRVINYSRQPSALPGIENRTWDALSAEALDLAQITEIHGLVYAPGSISLKPFQRFTQADLQQDLQINYLGAIAAIQCAFPLLKAAQHASVLMFSTVAVQTGMGFHASIAGAKGAVEGLTRALAAEFAPYQIRVNAIAPSLTDTDLAGSLLNSPEKVEASGKRHPLGRVGQVKDIASMALFLLDPANSWITGQVMKVDGGLGAVR